MTPDDRKYSKTHEWVKMEGAVAVIGITDYAQDALGDITFIELPAAGREVTQGGECGVIESVKVASDLYAPIAGKVAEANTGLETRPELVNSDPYGAGWIFKLKDVDAGRFATLMSAADYEATLNRKSK